MRPYSLKVVLISIVSVTFCIFQDIFSFLTAVCTVYGVNLHIIRREDLLRAFSCLQLIIFLIHLTTSQIMVLSQEDIDGCRQAFLAFDKDRSGTIDVWELRQVLVRTASNLALLYLLFISPIMFSLSHTGGDRHRRKMSCSK